jgi:signal transduction histidine kinase/DNA-binding response OmpR family regulator
MLSTTFLDGGGEMGALMRATDWTRTPLGAVDTWPQSLRTTVSTCLNSRFPILIWWGPQFVKLYNDAYREVIAGKHPRALGRPGREVWPEIWHIIGPMLESVVSHGAATWSEDQYLPLERLGFPEECYFTFAYSPIRDETGGVGGVFSAVTETTGRILGERRLRLLQTLASETSADSVGDACTRATRVLASDRADLPFAHVYLLDGGGASLRLAATTDEDATCEAPARVDLHTFEAPHGWPLKDVLETRAMVLADSGAAHSRAFVAPILVSQDAPAGVLVAGVSPMLPINEQYRGFAALVAREIGGSIAHARALEDERRRAAALAELDRAKTKFFSNVSHEFRTPLTLMLSPVEEAMRSAHPSLAGDELVTVHRNAQRLHKLVNTLLEFSRLEAGRTRVRFEPTDLARLTRDLASTFRSAMERAGLEYDVQCDPLRPIAVDRDAWEKIVLNLLSNALKFTFAGRVSLALRAAGDSVELEVRDTGVGIPAEELPRIFDRFHRVEGTRARTHEGSGIGLALVNELVRLHGGEVTAASDAGQGATFTVRIPMERPAAAAASADADKPLPSPIALDVVAQPYVTEALGWLPAAVQAAGAPGGATPPRPSPRARPAHDDSGPSVPGASGRPLVLLADDNADMRGYVARLLSDRCVVETAGDGAEALEAVRARRPALVISDVMMPRLDGFGLLRAIREDRTLCDLPVILLSARAGEEASVEGLDAGADDYVTKPFSARELRARVDAQLARAELRALLAAHERRLADMFRHAPAAVAVLRGADHVFDYANEEYFAVTGRRELLGRRLIDALPELEAQGIGELLDTVYASGERYSASSVPLTVNRGPDGAPEQAYFTVLCQPMRDAGGQVDAIAVIAIDVTEVALARQEAEAANRAKDEFLATLGHELRNPLASLLAAAQLLELKGPRDAALGRLRQTITRQTQQVARIVDDLLDVGRIVSGKLRLDMQRADMHAIARQAIEASMPFIEARHHHLVVSLPDAPACCDADPARMTQVVCNLLNNAAKFMDDGGTIELSVITVGGIVELSVRDHGVGIAPDMLGLVFERFVQAEARRERVGDGLGIGLALVKSIVELHGGTVVARSDGPGTGSEFVVAIPAALPAAAQAADVP